MSDEAGPARIWLLGYPDVSATWCEDPSPDGEDHGSIEYVRADLIASQQAEIARLRALVDDFARDCVKLHPIQRGPNLVKPDLGGSIILWAVDEIIAARAAIEGSAS